MSQAPEIIVYSDPEALALGAARLFREIAGDSSSARGVFRVALSGGTTPAALYRLLGTEEFAEGIDWSGVEIFWGDERCVPPDDRQSNYGSASTTLLGKVAIPASNIHRIKGELGERGAAEYEEEIVSAFALEEGGVPLFDCMLLGMGEDGHTASLFPGTGVVCEERRNVAAVAPKQGETARITLTPPVINSARHLLFIVSGRNKAVTLREVLEGDYRPDQFPAQITRLSQGRVRWLIDREAATELRRQPAMP